ncbi:hypothetical protein K2X16_16425 [Proteus mirabilis]|uniref:hypothetical protein n=1 Tax=Proteus mirabilis TaxID=584 RepID=UPI001C6F8D18|nr:hypothetical protein [Proteus mirabilis]MBW9253556.1 hypothetical protein [Proteus mirabilis]
MTGGFPLLYDHSKRTSDPVDYQARKPFLSFGKNPLPADFEQQVKQILAKLDQEKKILQIL